MTKSIRHLKFLCLLGTLIMISICQYCTQFSCGVCISCNPGMHLFKGFCINNVPSCLKHQDFVCIMCQDQNQPDANGQCKPQRIPVPQRGYNLLNPSDFQQQHNSLKTIIKTIKDEMVNMITLIHVSVSNRSNRNIHYRLLFCTNDGYAQILTTLESAQNNQFKGPNTYVHIKSVKILQFMTNIKQSIIRTLKNKKGSIIDKFIETNGGQNRIRFVDLTLVQYNRNDVHSQGNNTDYSSGPGLKAGGSSSQKIDNGVRILYDFIYFEADKGLMKKSVAISRKNIICFDK